MKKQFDPKRIENRNILRFGFGQVLHIQAYTTAVASLIGARTSPYSPLLAQSLLFWIIAAITARRRRYFLVLRRFQNRRVDAFVKNHLMPLLDRKGRVIAISQDLDTSAASSLSDSALYVVRPTFYGLGFIFWAAVFVAVYWCSGGWFSLSVQAVAILIGTFFTIHYLGGNRHLAHIRHAFLTFWWSLIVVQEIRLSIALGTLQLVLAGSVVVAFCIVVAGMWTVLTQRRIASKYLIKDLKDCQSLRAELARSLVFFPRYVPNAPLLRSGIFCADSVWREVVQILLRRVDAVFLDLSEIGEGLQWEIDAALQSGVPIILTCESGSDASRSLKNIQDRIFEWSDLDFSSDRAMNQFVALDEFIHQQTVARD